VKATDKTAVTATTADVLHFSCQSYLYSDFNGDKIRLELQLTGKEDMALPEPLDTRHISGWHLPVCRLVTLASNVQRRDLNIKETGKKQGTGSAGVCIGWLLAGASAVVYSLWYVQHECKTVFFAQFYDRMTAHGMDAAEALHCTQRWLREATQLDYVRGWPKEWQGISWTGNSSSFSFCFSLTSTHKQGHASRSLRRQVSVNW
jgi:CHAT domain-containing protein